MRKVYIAGDNIISSLGFSTSENVRNILEGRIGLKVTADPTDPNKRVITPTDPTKLNNSPTDAEYKNIIGGYATAVPVPAAAWSGLILLGGMVTQRLARRKAA